MARVSHAAVFYKAHARGLACVGLGAEEGAEEDLSGGDREHAERDGR